MTPREKILKRVEFRYKDVIAEAKARGLKPHEAFEFKAGAAHSHLLLHPIITGLLDVIRLQEQELISASKAFKIVSRDGGTAERRTTGALSALDTLHKAEAKLRAIAEGSE